jgi:uncharacterized repeat protein (TIGR03803 family)
MKLRYAVAFIVVVLVVSTTGTIAGAQTSTERVLHSFTGDDGAHPLGPMIMDSAGNLYGTTNNGGEGFGTVYELVKSDNYYALTFHAFTSANGDGADPTGGLVMDSSGDLFGTTYEGGTPDYGTVFELVNSDVGYTEKVLYSFTNTSGDGTHPFAGLITDKAGNLYGETNYGGNQNDGTIFELVYSSGHYTEKVLHSFGDTNGDGTHPLRRLLMDGSGNLFGTTNDGGAYGYGTVFELAKSLNGYTENVLYSFSGTNGDGANPEADLVMDGSGNIYGTTTFGGTYGGNPAYGTVFELVNSSSGYAEKVLGAFSGSSAGGGAYPEGGLVMDAFGNLYGTTIEGGAAGNGRVFKESVSSGETVIYDFMGYPDGEAPAADLLLDSSGHLFGTTEDGGTDGADGTVFEITLPQVPQAALSPSSLSFGSQIVNTASGAQTVSVENTGYANLVFGSGAVTISGSDSGDFSVASDSCSGVTLQPAGTCTVGVTFMPTLLASESSTLNFADNAADSPQTVPLSGTGADFLIAPASGSSASATVTAGGVAKYSLTLTPQGGFDQALSLACGSAPAESTCTLWPSSVTLDGTSAATVTVTVNTTAPSMLAPPGGGPPLSGRWPEVLLLGMMALLGALALGSARRAAGRLPRLRWAAMGAVLALLALLVASCGGGGGGSPSNPGTPAGTYTLSVTASTSGGFLHSTSLTLTVQ